MHKQDGRQVGEGGGGGPRLGRSYQLPSPGARVEEFANELSKVETIPVLHILQCIVMEKDTTTITLPGCRDRLQPRIRGGAWRRNHRRSCLPHGSRRLSCLRTPAEQLCHKAGLHLDHEEVCSILQVVVVVVLLVSCTMASLLSVLSTLRLLAVPHDIYYVHYGLASLMCNLYSSLLASGLLAGLASLTLLTATCLRLPACVSHNQVGPQGQQAEKGQDGSSVPIRNTNHGGWRQTL